MDLHESMSFTGMAICSATHLKLWCHIGQVHCAGEHIFLWINLHIYKLCFYLSLKTKWEWGWHHRRGVSPSDVNGVGCRVVLQFYISVNKQLMLHVIRGGRPSVCMHSEYCQSNCSMKVSMGLFERQEQRRYCTCLTPRRRGCTVGEARWELEL